MRETRGSLGAGAATAALALLSGCVFMPPAEQLAADAPGPAAPDPAAPRLESLDARHFELADADDELLGEMQVLFARYENTFPLIAREHNVGYEELRQANPDVDVWLPGEGTPIYLPTLSVMPDAPREGIVLNLPSMRLLYFSAEPSAELADAASAAAPVAAETAVQGTGFESVVQGAAAEAAVQAAPSKRLYVTSHPIGIGREGWATPTGGAAVTDKARDPTWYPPASVRAEHAALGDPLPSVVPPGPDNPLGRHALALSMPGYLIHGTNKPAGVGMRVSHGCIRLYPEDIEALFERVPRGTPVQIVDQPVLAGWRNGELYLEVHAPLAEDERDLDAETERVIVAALERRAARVRATQSGAVREAGAAREVAEIAAEIAVEIDWEAVRRVVAERRGIPFPVLAEGPTFEAYLAGSRIIDNQVRPLQAWQSTP